jgi:hypothetical protein
MAIIELARLKLLGGMQSSDPDLRRILRTIKGDMEGFNKLTTNFFADVDNPDITFCIGSWASPSQHAKEYVGSPGQRMILKMVKDVMEIEWMHYIDVEYSDIPTEANLLVLTRFQVSGNETKTDTGRQDFESHWAKGLQETQAVADNDGPKVVGAWRLARKPGEWLGDMWLQFAGWNNLDDRKLFNDKSSVKDLDTARTTLMRLA